MKSEQTCPLLTRQRGAHSITPSKRMHACSVYRNTVKRDICAGWLFSAIRFVRDIISSSAYTIAILGSLASNATQCAPWSAPLVSYGTLPPFFGQQDLLRCSEQTCRHSKLFWTHKWPLGWVFFHPSKSRFPSWQVLRSARTSTLVHGGFQKPANRIAFTVALDVS